MTTTLITGKGGTPHITSGDMGAMQAGIIGNGSYLLQGSDGTFPTVTMQDANHALIPVLNLVVEGRYARVTEAETATIESGITGRNRNDLVCLKYTRNGQNIETAAIAVLKGTPNTGTAADPTVPSGSIHSASGTVWIPIARIPISGITPGTPVMLIKQLPPMSKLWDSVTQTLIKSQYGTVTGVKSGKIAQISINWKSASTDSWGSGQFGTIPEGWRPAVVTHGTWSGRDGGSQRDFILETNGNFRYVNCGAGQNSGTFSGTMTYILA
ncbi:hypothetical protein PL707_07635 [Bifidobacterium catenulatum]|uniref:Tail fiber protein n=1 Tax=Bifidobacterium catenulatum TaxID=1686 RepID=A0AAW5ZZ20_9BIFI|nr:hypothetical protein [Bifidobacterium catenulatum]MDB1162135.1 hypothetical protein [Bifidobacterium catenulatum]